MNILEHIMELALPYIITVLEIMGILVVGWSGIQSFWWYIQNAFLKRVTIYNSILQRD